MRQFFCPPVAPPWLRMALDSIRDGLTDIWSTPIRPQHYATADLPPAANWKGGIVYDSTTDTLKKSDGSSWVEISQDGWRLLGSGFTAAGVWDQAVDGSTATIAFTGLAGATDLRLIMRQVTKAVSGAPVVHVSVDNGATWFTTSGNYAFSDVNGVATNVSSMAQFHLTNATAARDGIVEIQNANKGLPVGLNVTANASHRLFLASSSPINAVRITSNNGGNFTGGKFYCLVR